MSLAGRMASVLWADTRLRLDGFSYAAATGEAPLEVPLAERIAPIRARKAEHRKRDIAPRATQEPLQALPEHPLPCRAVPRPDRVRARGRRAAQLGTPGATPGRRLRGVVKSAHRTARTPFRRAVPLQGRGQVPIVRGAALVEAPVNVLHLPAEVAQAHLAGGPMGRGKDAGQGRGRRGGDGPSVLAQDEAPVAGQVVQPVQQQDSRDARRRSPASGRSPPAREPRAYPPDDTARSSA